MMDQLWTTIKSQRINVQMIPVKAFGSLLYLATTITFPFLTLQMLNIGLDLYDVSIVYGLAPLATFLTSPLAGYIGDKIGYNAVLVVNLIGAGVFSTAFDWTPRYHEYQRQPIISTYLDHENVTQIMTFQWPLDCNLTNITVEDCQDNLDYLQSQDFWFNVNVTCDANQDLNLQNVPYFEFLEVGQNKNNEPYCRAFNNQSINGSLTSYEVCNYDEFDLSSCHTTIGSHSKTFWVYFALRMLYQMTLIACYSSFDGTALRQSRKYNSNYAWVTFYCNAAAALGPVLAAFTIRDAPEGSEEENDYSLAFYTADGLYFLSMVVSLFVKVDLGKDPDEDSKESKKAENRKAIRELFSPSALIFFAILFQGGIMWGVKDTYFYVYIQDELNGDSQLISYTNTIGVVSGLFVLPIAKWIIESVGHVHICYASIIVDCGRLVLCSYIKQSPPYYIYGLAWMDALCATLYWTSAIMYGYRIAPPTLVGTMAALTGSVNWIIAKGLSSFVAGQLVGNEILTISEMFQVICLYTSVAATVFYLVYLCIGRSLEVKQVLKVEQQREQLESKNSEIPVLPPSAAANMDAGIMISTL